MVAWWGKLRKAWGAITSRLIKSGSGKKKKINNGTPLEADQGYLKLRSDVENCEYEDVHVLWNMLTQMHGDGDGDGDGDGEEDLEAANAVPPAPPPSATSSPPSPPPPSPSSSVNESTSTTTTTTDWKTCFCSSSIDHQPPAAAS